MSEDLSKIVGGTFPSSYEKAKQQTNKWPEWKKSYSKSLMETDSEMEKEMTLPQLIARLENKTAYTVVFNSSTQKDRVSAFVK